MRIFSIARATTKQLGSGKRWRSGVCGSHSCGESQRRAEHQGQKPQRHHVFETERTFSLRQKPHSLCVLSFWSKPTLNKFCFSSSWTCTRLVQDTQSIQME